MRKLAVFRGHRLRPGHAGVLVEGAAAALALRHDDPHVVFHQHADSGEVDLAEKRLHQAAGEQGHGGTGRPSLGYQPPRIGAR